MSLNKKNKEKEYFFLIGKIFKNDFTIIKNNFIIITGVNGVGKSHFLNQIKNNKILFITKKTKNNQKNNSLFIMHNKSRPKIFGEEFDLLEIDFTNKEELKNIMTKIVNNYPSIWLDYFEVGLKPPFPTLQYITEFTNLNHKGKTINLNDYTGEIIDLNNLISTSIKNNFKDLLSSFKKHSSFYLEKEVKNKINKNVENVEEHKLIKIIKLLNNYLENKKVVGLSSELNKIEFYDLNNSINDKKELSIDNLSEGEKILFVLASEFAENKQKDKMEV